VSRMIASVSSWAYTPSTWGGERSAILHAALASQAQFAATTWLPKKDSTRIGASIWRYWRGGTGSLLRQRLPAQGYVRDDVSFSHRLFNGQPGVPIGDIGQIVQRSGFIAGDRKPPASTPAGR